MVISRRSLSAPYEYKWSVLEMSSGPHETTWRRKLARAGAHDTRRCTCPSQHAGVKEKPVLVGISIGRIAHVKAFFVHFLMSLQQAKVTPLWLENPPEFFFDVCVRQLGLRSVCMNRFGTVAVAVRSHA